LRAVKGIKTAHGRSWRKKKLGEKKDSAMKHQKEKKTKLPHSSEELGGEMAKRKLISGPSIYSFSIIKEKNF